MGSTSSHTGPFGRQCGSSRPFRGTAVHFFSSQSASPLTLPRPMVSEPCAASRNGRKGGRPRRHSAILGWLAGEGIAKAAATRRKRKNGTRRQNHRQFFHALHCGCSHGKNQVR